MFTINTDFEGAREYVEHLRASGWHAWRRFSPSPSPLATVGVGAIPGRDGLMCICGGPAYTRIFERWDGQEHEVRISCPECDLHCREIAPPQWAEMPRGGFRPCPTNDASYLVTRAAWAWKQMVRG